MGGFYRPAWEWVGPLHSLTCHWLEISHMTSANCKGLGLKYKTGRRGNVFSKSRIQSPLGTVRIHREQFLV
jgi:hypothetical protein